MWIVIPVYGEEKVIASVVEHVLQIFPNVVCVDDGSPDNSAAEISGTGAHLVRHPINMGQGAALQTGMEYALARTGGQYFVTFDADGQHRVEDVQNDARGGPRRRGRRRARLPVPRGRQPPRRPCRGSSGCCCRSSPGSARPRGGSSSPTRTTGCACSTRTAADDLRITQNRMAHASEIVGWLARSKWKVHEVP